MIISCKPGEEIYLFEYMYLVNKTEILSPFSIVLYGIELLLLAITLFLAILVAYLNSYEPIWHRNLQILMNYFVVGCIPSLFSRLGFVFWEVSLAEDTCRYSLVLATILRLQYAFAIMHACAALILERAAAFYFLKDYEKKSRCYIPLTILFFQIILSTFMAIYNIYYSVTFQALFIYMSALATFSIVSFCALWQMNLYKFRRIGISTKVKDYSLSKRFQLTENLRAFQSIRNVEISCVIMLFIVGAAGYFMVNQIQGALILVHLFEGLVSCSPGILTATLLMSSTRWRQLIYEKISGKTTTSEVRATTSEEEGHLHFSELNKAWNNRRTITTNFS